MKQLFALIFAAVFGSLLTLGGYHFFLNNDVPQLTSSAPAQQVSYNLPPAENAPLDFKTASRRSMPAVVHISARQTAPQVQNQNENRDMRGNDFFRFFFDGPNGGPNMFGPKQGTGSGVIYTRDGYIITNNHVVEFADEVDVTLYDNRKFKATVVGTDPKSDLAVLKIEGDDFPVLRVGDSDAVEVGEWVLAVGNPFDLTSTVTAGIVSAKGRSINLLGGGTAIESFIQTDAAVNPGNSGGALVDTEGRLVGINTAIASRTGSYAGYSFAIPVNLVQRIADDIIEYGSFKRAFLGVNISELDSDRAGELGVEFTQGVVVEELVDGGSAQYAGVLPMDIILAVDGRDIRTVPELQEAIGRAKAGDIVMLTVFRKNGSQDIPVTLKAG